MRSENLNNATVRTEVCSTYETHTRFQSLHVEKDNKNYLCLFNVKMIIILGISGYIAIGKLISLVTFYNVAT